MRRHWAFLVAGASCLRAAFGDPLYTVRDLGLLPGATGTAATAINNAGVVVGASLFPDGTQTLFRYDGFLHDLGSFPGSRGTLAAGVNSTGQIAGGAGTGFDPPGPRPFLYNGTYHDLGTLDAQSGEATGINDSGQVVGTLTFPDVSQRAFYYDGMMHDLSAALGGGQSTAAGINNSGHIVGSLIAPLQQGARHQAFLYDGTVHLLGELVPGKGSDAVAISGTGLVAGNSPLGGGANGSEKAAFIWDGAIHQLQPPANTVGDPGDVYATGVNAPGQVVGYASPFEAPSLAVIWDAGTHQGHYLDDLANLPSGWVMEVATGVNDSGQVVGYANQIGPDGRPIKGEHSFLLTPRIPGDANLDGSVGFDDLLILAQHYGAQTTHFTDGDFDGSGTVAFPDLLLLAQHYGDGISASSATVVPEPNDLAVLLAIALAPGLIARQRRA